MTPSSPKGMLLNAMKGKMLKSFKEAVGSDDITTENMEEEITNKLMLWGESRAKKWLVEERGFDEDMVNKGLVWNKSRKGRGGSVTMRGGLKDIMDYEFYGVQKGVWPNIQRLASWVEFRVIQRDHGLRKEYFSKTDKGQANMVERLTYLFGKAIHDNGLQRYATMDPTDNQPTSKEEEEFRSKYDEPHEPIVVYYRRGTRQRSRRIVPRRRFATQEETADTEAEKRGLYR